MDEMTNVNEVVDTEPVADEFSGGLTDAEFDALWDEEEGDYGFVEDGAESETEADQQTEEPAEAEETEPAEAEQPKDDGADQYLELKHFDEVRKVSKDEAKVLAQKGMDYDRIRGKYDEVNAQVAELQTYKNFLEEIKGDFASIDDLMLDTRAKILSGKENISYEDAVAKVKAANQPKEQPPQIDRDQVILDLRNESIQAFVAEHRDLKFEDIPAEVWADVVNVTNNLGASYAKYEAKKIAEENAVLKKNAENKSRAVGSMKSSGKSQRDEFDEMWYEDDY